jgi:Spy/CpxP family protein refolding chaperone
VTWTATSPSKGLRLLSIGLLCVGGAVMGAGALIAAQAPKEKALPVSQSGAVSPSQPGTNQSGEGRRGFGPPGDGRGGRGGDSEYKFWRDPAAIKEIGLAADQGARIDRIYEGRARQIAPFADELVKQRAELDRLIRERTVDPSAVELQASKVTALFAKMQESRFVMLYRMYLVLTPDQYKKLQALFDRQRAGEHGRGRSGNAPRP